MIFPYEYFFSSPIVSSLSSLFYFLFPIFSFLSSVSYLLPPISSFLSSLSYFPFPAFYLLFPLSCLPFPISSFFHLCDPCDSVRDYLLVLNHRRPIFKASNILPGFVMASECFCNRNPGNYCRQSIEYAPDFLHLNTSFTSGCVCSNRDD